MQTTSKEANSSHNEHASMEARLTKLTIAPKGADFMPIFAAKLPNDTTQFPD